MKKTLNILLILALVTIPLLGQDEEKDEGKKTEVKAKIGAGAAVHSNDGNLGKVGEYLVLPDSVRPIAKAKVDVAGEKFFLKLDSWYSGDADDQDHALNFNVNRVFDQKLSYSSLIHRLDPVRQEACLAVMQAVTGSTSCRARAPVWTYLHRLRASSPSGRR